MVVQHSVNGLPSGKRIAILKLRDKGVSNRSIGHARNISRITSDDLLRHVGPARFGIHDLEVSDVAPQRIQTDEIWSFCHVNQRNVAVARAALPAAGRTSTWLAIYPDSIRTPAVCWHATSRRTFLFPNLAHQPKRAGVISIPSARDDLNEIAHSRRALAKLQTGPSGSKNEVAYACIDQQLKRGRPIGAKKNDED